MPFIGMGAGLLVLACTLAMMWSVPVQSRPGNGPETTAEQATLSAEAVLTTVSDGAVKSVVTHDGGNGPSGSVFNSDNATSVDPENAFKLKALVPTSDGPNSISSITFTAPNVLEISNWTNASVSLPSNLFFNEGDVSQTSVTLVSNDVNFLNWTSSEANNEMNPHALDPSIEIQLSRLSVDVQFGNLSSYDNDQIPGTEVNNSVRPTSNSPSAVLDSYNDVTNLTYNSSTRSSMRATEPPEFSHGTFKNLTDNSIIQQDGTRELSGASFLLSNATLSNSTSLKSKRGAHISPVQVHNKFGASIVQAENSLSPRGNISRGFLRFDSKFRDHKNDDMTSERSFPDSKISRQNESVSQGNSDDFILIKYNLQRASSSVNVEQAVNSDTMSSDVYQSHEIPSNHSTSNSVSLTDLNGTSSLNIFNGSENFNLEDEFLTLKENLTLPNERSEEKLVSLSTKFNQRDENVLDSLNMTTTRASKTVTETLLTNADEEYQLIAEAAKSSSVEEIALSNDNKHNQVTIPFMEASFQIETPGNFSLVEIASSINFTVQPHEICENETNRNESIGYHSLEFDTISAHSDGNGTELDAAEIELATNYEKSAFNSKAKSPEKSTKSTEKQVKDHQLFHSILNVTETGSEIPEQFFNTVTEKLNETSSLNSRNESENESFSTERNSTFKSVDIEVVSSSDQVILFENFTPSSDNPFVNISEAINDNGTTTHFVNYNKELFHVTSEDLMNTTHH